MTATFPSSVFKTGVIIGSLTEKSNQRARKYLFLCRCGYARFLKNNAVESRGCNTCEREQKRLESGRRCWSSILDRCLKAHHGDYPSYGGRGITVCDDWVKGRNGATAFQTFSSDMGIRPSRRHTVHRIDNSLGYTPTNCKWADDYEQNNNKTDNVIITAHGKSMTIAQWSREVGLDRKTIRHRLNLGWSHDRVLSAPHRPRSKRSSS